MAYSHIVKAVHSQHADASRRGLYFQHHEGAPDGRVVRMAGRELLWFGSCSYMGLEHHPALVDGAVAAVRSAGTQFASSRGYVSLEGHRALEQRLARMFGRPALIGQTTTLAHIAWFDACVDERDVVFLDHQVHASVHAAARHAMLRGTPVHPIRHESLESGLEGIAHAARTARRVVFATDGITSMYGDHADYGLLKRILDIAPNVWLYVDDAHGTGWAGTHGRGPTLERFGGTPRLVVATSLAKSFAAGGAALLLPTEEMREHVRMCGSTMVFSGPLQPALLGAALASADVHLSDALPDRQRSLYGKVRRLKRGLRDVGVDIVADNDVPIAFIEMVKPGAAMEAIAQLADRGFYANVSMFPSVPHSRSGLRVTVTDHLLPEDIDRFVEAAGEVVPAVLHAHALSRAQVLTHFQNTRVGLEVPVSRRPETARPHGLLVDHHHAIAQVDAAEWDSLMGADGCITAAAMAVAEAVYSSDAPAEDWRFHYLIVRGAEGAPLAATVFVEMLAKDDMFSEAVVSRAVEAERRHDPHRFCSRVLMMGGGISEGSHLYLRRSGPWRDALACLLDEAVDIYERRQLDAIVLRDLPADAEVDAALRDEGFTSAPLPDRHLIELPPGGYRALFADQSRRSRRFLEQRLDEHVGFRFADPDPTTPWSHLWGLYRDVAGKNLALNMHLLPQRLLPALAGSPAWDLRILTLPAALGGPEDGRPVAFYGAHRHAGSYAPLLCGLDYRYVESHGTYRHLLVEMVLRAEALGCSHIDFGMTAGAEKHRLGSTPEPLWVWTFARDSWQRHQLAALTERVHLQRRS